MRMAGALSRPGHRDDAWLLPRVGAHALVEAAHGLIVEHRGRLEIVAALIVRHRVAGLRADDAVDRTLVHALILERLLRALDLVGRHRLARLVRHAVRRGGGRRAVVATAGVAV